MAPASLFDTDLTPTAAVADEDLPVVMPTEQLYEDWLVSDGDSQERDSEASPMTGRFLGFSPWAPQMRPAAIPALPHPSYRFDLRHQWEGTVTEVHGEAFVAVLKDLTEGHQVGTEEATFRIEEVAATDVKRVEPGALFRWSIGYRIEGGQKERVSRIHFARLPGWSRRAIDRIEEEAAELQRYFPGPISP